MKKIVTIGALLVTTACAVTPVAVEPGLYETEAGFTVELDQPWSMWASSINYETTGEYLTQDGPLLNRLHFISLEDGEAVVRAPKNTPDLPRYSLSASELETVDMVTASLTRIGYSTMEADNIQPTNVDGQEGLRFDLSGKWKNGLNVGGLAVAVKDGDTLKLALFLSPEEHYYGKSVTEVEAILESIDLG